MRVDEMTDLYRIEAKEQPGPAAIVFSAREPSYRNLCTLTDQWLDFDEVRVHIADEGSFRVSLADETLPIQRPGVLWIGRFRYRDDPAVAAI